MYIDEFGQQILSDDDICNQYLINPEIKLKRVLVNNNINIPDILDIDVDTEFVKYQKPNLTLKEFDSLNQTDYYMPEEYKTMDIALYVLNQCTTDAELQRAGEELFLYQERNLFPLLRYLKYLVDTMRKHNIVWGVGRGSSVSSYVLYLLGIHRINSIHYDLSIDEFLK